MSLNRSINDDSSKFEERYNSLSFNLNHSLSLSDRSLNNSRRTIRLPKKTRSLVFSNHENSFVLKQSIGQRNIDIYQQYIRNRVVLDYLRSSAVPIFGRTESVDFDESSGVLKDYYAILLFLSCTLAELKDDFKMLKFHHPMYIVEGKNFRSYLLNDKNFYIELIKDLLKYDEQIILGQLVQQYGTSPMFLSKKIISFFLEFGQLETLKQLLIQLFGSKKYKVDEKSFMRKLAKIVNVMFVEGETEFLRQLLPSLSFEPAVLIGDLIRIGRPKTIHDFIKLAKIELEDKIYAHFIEQKNYDYFLFSKISSVSQFLYNKKRVPHVR
jgi:hypothetical protein